MKRILTIASFLTLSHLAWAAPAVPTGDLLKLGVVPPETVARHLSALGLSPDQDSAIRELVKKAKSETSTLDTSIREYRDLLEEIVKQPAASIDEAEARLNKLLEAEASAKRLQLRTILGINAQLTGDQRAKALELARRDVELESVIKAKIDRIKSAVDAIGCKPTPAIEARGQAIRELTESGDLAEVDRALDKAIADLGIDEAAQPVKPVDFASYEPGNVELTALEERYRKVEEKVQGVIRLSTLRQLLQAKDALDTAKAAQDAVAAGSVLTWAESVLP